MLTVGSPLHTLIQFVLILILAKAAVREAPGETDIYKYPQDFLIDQSFSRNSYITPLLSSSKAYFTCPWRNYSNIVWYHVLFGHIIQKVPLESSNLPSIYKLSEKSPTLFLEKNIQNRDIFCKKKDSKDKKEQSRIAKLRTLKAEAVRIQVLEERSTDRLITCARSDHVHRLLHSKQNVTTFVYASSGQYRYDIHCRNDNRKCHQRQFQSAGPFAVVAGQNSHLSITCVKHWTPHFILNATNPKLPEGIEDLLPTKPLLFTTKQFPPRTGDAVTDGQPSIVILQTESGLPAYTARQGYNITLICLVLGASARKLQWLRSDQAISPQGRVRSTVTDLTAQLDIESFDAEVDKGEYRCEVEIQGRKHLKRHFIISGLVENVALLNESIFLRGDMQRPIACCDKNRNAGVWMFKGRIVETKNRDQNGCPMLHLSKVTKENLGTYKCVVDLKSMLFGLNTKDYANWLLTPPHNESSQEQYRDCKSVEECSTVKEFRLEIDKRNLHSPMIQPSTGTIKKQPIQLSVNLTSRTEEQLVMLLVEDKDEDKDAAGKVKCNVTSSPGWHNNSLILKSEIDNKGGLFIEVWTNATGNFKKRRFEVTCTDSGKVSKNTKIQFEVDSCLKCSHKKSKVTKQLITLVKGIKPNETQEVLDTLENITSNAKPLTSFDLTLSLKAVTNITDAISIKKDKESTEEGLTKLTKVTKVVSNILRVNDSVLKETTDVSDQVLTVVELLRETIPLNENNTNRVIPAESLVVAAAKVDESETGKILLTIPYSLALNDSRILKKAPPTAAVSLSIDSKSIKTSRVDFSFYKDAAIFRSENNSMKVVSPVIAAKTKLKKKANPESSGGKGPVALYFNGTVLKLKIERGRDNNKYACAFWNTTSKNWDKAGCQPSSNEPTTVGQIRCTCNHLTNFALIMNMDEKNLSPTHSVILSGLSYFLLTLSCISLIITIYIYISYLKRKLSKARSGHLATSSAIRSSRLFLSFCFTLLLTHFFFLITAYYNTPGVLCKVIGALFHYLVLSVFAWSVIEAFQVFISVVYVSMRDSSVMVQIPKFYIKAAVFGWGTPALIVALTLGISHAVMKEVGYGLPSFDGRDPGQSICFMKRESFQIAFLIPLLLCLLLNTIVMGLLAYIFFFRLNDMAASKKSKSNRKIIGLITVCLILNITWIFGVFNFGYVKGVMNYLFVIFNGLQGFFIFICYCVLKKEVLVHMKSFVWCFHWLPVEEKTSTTSRTQPSTGETEYSRKYSTAQQIPLVSSQSSGGAAKSRIN